MSLGQALISAARYKPRNSATGSAMHREARRQVAQAAHYASLLPELISQRHTRLLEIFEANEAIKEQRYGDYYRSRYHFWVGRRGELGPCLMYLKLGWHVSYIQQLPPPTMSLHAVAVSLSTRALSVHQANQLLPDPPVVCNLSLSRCLVHTTSHSQCSVQFIFSC